MKKRVCITVVSVIFVALTNLTITPAKAGNVDEKTARKAAAYYMAAQMGNKSITPASLDLAYTISNAQLNVPAVYVFNGGNGFVMVAGSDCISPIIAYSDEHPFNTNKVNPNMMYMLSGFVNAISEMQNTKAVQPAYAQEEWSQLLEQRLPYFGSAKAVTRLTTSKWSQEAPYYNMCPEINGERSVTGCVATAMAQVMYYWKYPIQGGSRTINYRPYTNGGTMGVLSLKYDTCYFNYDLMEDDMSNVTDEQKTNAVALLNYACGVSVHMDYDPQGSGASTSTYLMGALTGPFKYKNNIKQVSRDRAPFVNTTGVPSLGDTLWVDTLRNEINHRRPVIYCGADTRPNVGADARHAFICDGYNSMNKLFRFNWGWGYMDNSCWVNVLTSRLTAMQYVFNSDNVIYLNVQPPADSVAIAEVEKPILHAAYPNPASMQIHLPYTSQDNGVMQIFSIDGRLVESRKVLAGSNEVVLNLAGYPQGIYVYRLNGASSKFIVK
ncbi:MAG: thiol protease/hemagglutinin PrtT [Bacteroidales bacterium]|nr:thiol protease/hemagglutinin PrtT [Bacteroidales bacterium]